MMRGSGWRAAAASAQATCLLCASLFAMFAPFAPFAAAQTAPSPTVGGLPDATQPNALEQLTARTGISTCMAVVQRAAPALTGPAGTFAAMLLANPVSPDASSFSASIERVEAGSTRFVSAVFSPTRRGGCDISYEIVESWTRPCAQVAAKDFGYTRALNVVGKSIGVVPIGPSHHVYLMPTAADGCISITKELLFP